MPVAARIAILTLLTATAACGAQEQEQPQANAAAADIEALPADESSTTSSDELANGVNDPDVSDLGNQH